MQEQQSSLLKTKKEWTQELYQHYVADDNRLPPRDLNILFWYNLHETRGFRLTPRGFEIVKTAGYTLYHHKLDLKTFPVTSKLLVTLDRVCNTPYFLNAKADIILMDEKLSVIMELSGGDLFRAVELYT